MNYYQKKIESLNQELKLVRSDLREVILNPDSMNSFEIRIRVGVQDKLEKSLWFGKGKSCQTTHKK